MDNSVEDSKGHVAIIGSGPAGLFAAWALQNGGYTVTIFEKVRQYNNSLLLAVGGD